MVAFRLFIGEKPFPEQTADVSYHAFHERQIIHGVPHMAACGGTDVIRLFRGRFERDRNG